MTKLNSLNEESEDSIQIEDELIQKEQEPKDESSKFSRKFIGRLILLIIFSLLFAVSISYGVEEYIKERDAPRRANTTILIDKIKGRQGCVA